MLDYPSRRKPYERMLVRAIGEEVRRWRSERDLSLETFASMCQLSKELLMKIERQGRVHITVIMLMRLGLGMGIGSDLLLKRCADRVRGQLETDYMRQAPPAKQRRKKRSSGSKELKDGENSLTTRGRRAPIAWTHPWTIEWWSKTGNGSLTPFDVTKGCTRAVTWKCPKGPDHVFSRRVSAMIVEAKDGIFCPYCAGRLVSVTNSLASVAPKLAKEFDAVANGMRPTEVVAKYYRNPLNWNCSKCGHHWVDLLGHRLKGAGCPRCVTGNGNEKEAGEATAPHNGANGAAFEDRVRRR